jgi:hypothetical protein
MNHRLHPLAHRLQFLKAESLLQHLGLIAGLPAEFDVLPVDFLASLNAARSSAELKLRSAPC